jgi:hypothetical protein
MAVELFSLVLDKAISWGIGYLLDTFVSCGKCNYSHNRSVNNYETSNLLCPKCNSLLDQYTNATNHTVNNNGSIAAAYVSNIHWDRWGNIWQPNFNPHFDIDIVNSKYEDFVIRLKLYEFQSDIFFQDETILRPRSERYQWKDYWWKIPPNNFPDKGGTFAVEIEVLNTWGDELHRKRSLGQFTGRN